MKKIIAGLLATLMIASSLGIVSVSVIGEPVQDEPMATSISDIAGLQAMVSDLGANYYLTADIDASETRYWNNGEGFMPVGLGSPFTGTFDGNGFSIKNLYMNRTGILYGGLFGNANGATFSNVILLEADIKADYNIGGVVGDANNCDISGCTVVGEISGLGSIGGIAGNIDSTSSVIDCISFCDIEGSTYYFGGIVAYNDQGTITECGSNGDILTTDGSSMYVGGLVGYNNVGSITDCYSTSNVLGNNAVGGLIGCDVLGTVTRAHASGFVDATGFQGGITGWENGGPGTYTNCYWDQESTDQASASGGTAITATGIATTNDAITNLASYTNLISQPEWRRIDGETRPMLTMETSYGIFTPHQLQLMHFDLAGDYTQIHDIDMSGTSDPAKIWGAPGFYPVGSIATSFTGTFNGQGHVISNLQISRPTSDYVGLFGATSGATLSWIYIENASVLGDSNVGILASQTNSATMISNCSSSGYVSGTFVVAGLVGEQGGTTLIEYSSSMADVDGGQHSGGLVGYMNVGTYVYYSFATGDVDAGASNYGGGLVGYSAHVYYSYATGNVQGNNYIGGLIGYKWGDVEYSYSSGHVSSNFLQGGLVGDDGTGAETNCFWDIDTSGQATTSGGGTGLTTAEALNDFTYTSAGWDFTNTWFSINGSTRPFLQWEYSTEIRNSHQLQLMQMNLTTDYELANDIDMSGTAIPSDMWGTSIANGGGFSPMGVFLTPFIGSLDGMEYNINNLYINRTTETIVGLFGWVSNSATIDNINFIDVDVTGKANVGALSGLCQGQVTNCNVTGKVSGTNNDYIGGLLGQNNGIIRDSRSMCEVEGQDSIGGLVGVSNAEIINCTSWGNVSGTGDKIGGLVGENNGDVNNCQSYGHVDGDSYVGGLLGENTGEVNNSHAFGEVNTPLEVAHWTMDEASWTGAADEVIDSSGNNNHGTAENGVTTVPGMFGMVGNFVASSAHRVNIPDSSSLNLEDGIVVSAWVNTTYDGFLQTIVGKDDDGAGGRSWHLCVQNTFVRFNVWTPVETMLVGSVNVSTGTWRHIVAVYDGLDMMIYVDGALDADTSKSGTIADSTGEPVQIGCMNNNWHFDGLIDEVQIYSYEFPGDYIGGLAGYNDGIISNSTAHGYVEGDNYVGGLIGESSGNVSHSNAYGDTVCFMEEIGGLIGMNSISGTVDSCEAFGNVEGMDAYVGGLIGENWGPVNNSHAHGIINGTTSSETGGVLGYNRGNLTNSSFDGIVNGERRVGGLVGAHSDGLIEDCWSNGTINGIDYDIGGLVGRSYSPISSSISYGQVICVNSDNVGGLIGYNQGGTVNDCESYSNISNNGNRTGGLIGLNDGPVNNCSSNGTVSNPAPTNMNRESTGGFIGENAGSTVTNCQAYGDVDGNKFYTGGFVGYLSSGIISNSSSYGLTELTGITGSYMGGFVGSTAGIILSCNAYGDVGSNTFHPWIGGFAGRNEGLGIIQNSSAHGDVIGGGLVGGFVGENMNQIEICFSEGDSIGSGDRLGGFVGRNGGTTIGHEGEITDCYSHGNVSGNAQIGGFAGNHTQAGSTLTNVYSTGQVTGNSGYGGLVGVDWAGGITGSYWNTETSGQATSVAGTGRNDYEMMQQSTFNSWDFTGVWGIHEANTYPFLLPFGVPPEPVADMEITITDIQDPATVGNILTYNVTLENRGPDNAANLVVNITLPSEVSYDSASQAGFVINGRYITADIPSFEAGEFGYVHINVIVNSYGTGVLNCTANVTSSTLDPGVYANESYELTEVNRPPVATNDTTQTTEDDIQLIYPDFGILFNDNDPDGDNITVVGHEDSDFGAIITIEADGNLTYDPTGSATLQALHSGEYLIDTFNYTISDGRGGTATATISVNVSGNSANPTAVNDAFTIDEDSGPQTLDVLANDIVDEEGDVFTITQVNNGVHGTVTISADSLSVIYEQTHANYTGTDTFTYWISDGGNVIPAQVNITIENVNDAPHLQSNMFFVDEDSGENTLDVLASAIDGDGDDLEITGVTQPDNGAVTIIESGKNLTYEPDANFYGNDYFNCTVSDGNGGTDTIMVIVEVASVNDPPVITTESLDDATVGVPYSFTLTGTDADNQTLMWQMDSNADWLIIGNDGVLNGTPTEAGTFWVDILVADNGGNGTDSKNFTLEINESTDTGTDTDGDGIPDATDPDDDDDGVLDVNDDFPLDATETTDTDGDGTGDNADAFPTDPAASVDTDGDGMPDEWNDGYTADDSTTGLVEDDDDDNDGTPDSEDDTPVGDDDTEESSSSNAWLYIIIILVIVGIVAAVLVMRPKGPKPESAAPVEKIPPMEEQTPEQPASDVEPSSELEGSTLE